MPARTTPGPAACAAKGKTKPAPACRSKSRRFILLISFFLKRETQRELQYAGIFGCCCPHEVGVVLRCAVRTRQIDAVQHVESFETQKSGDAFGNREALKQACIDRRIARSSKGVPTEIAKRA